MAEYFGKIDSVGVMFYRNVTLQGSRTDEDEAWSYLHMSHHPLFIMDSYQLTQTSTMRCHGKMSELKANCSKISLTKSVT